MCHSWHIILYLYLYYEICLVSCIQGAAVESCLLCARPAALVFSLSRNFGNALDLGQLLCSAFIKKKIKQKHLSDQL